MTQTNDNIVNRDELQEAYIESIIDGMDHKDLWQYVYDQLADNFDKYTVDELITEVEDYYPHLLTNKQWDLSSPPLLSSSAHTSASTLLTLFQTFKMKNYNDSAKLIPPSQQIVQKYRNDESDGDWDDILSPDDIEEYYERRQYEKMMRP